MEGMEEEMEDVEEEEEMEDDDNDGGEEEEVQTEKPAELAKPKSRRKPRSVVTGRGVTLAMLLDDGVMEPGEKCLSIDYLGQKFVADLQPDGRIRWPEANQLFNSPSAWAIYCKRLVNPSKKSGCGWASVKYKGKKLDQYKTTWFRKQNSPVQASSNREASSAAKQTPTSSQSTMSVTRQPISSLPYDSPSKTSKSQSNTSHSHASLSSLSSSSSSSSSSNALSNKTPTSHSDSRHPQQSLSLSPSMTSFQSPTTSASSHAKDPNQKHHRPSSLGSSWSLEAKHAIKFPSMPAPSSRGRKPNIGLTHPPSDGLSSPFSPTALTISTPKSAGLVKSPVDLLSPLTSPTTPSSRKRPTRTRQSAKYSVVSPDSDPHTLVELVNFSATGKMQPFSVDISTNCLLLMDYHCHLTASEVTGYLAGQFDPQTHHMKIVQAFPCRCRFADKENAHKVEEELQNAIAQRGLILVGWYHSHPTYQPDPSIQDINNQLKYQGILQHDAAPYGPCLGVILSPYDSYRPTKESVIRAFWVQSPSDSQGHKLGVPMLMNTTLHQDQFLTQDLLNELRWMWSFYKGSPDTITFQHGWHGNQTYLDKVKASLIKKFPTDQTDGRFLEFINTLLT